MKLLELGNLKPVFTMDEKFHREEERLKTFETWPISFQNPKNLSITGMFYTGVADRTICYFCGVQIECWKREDIPLTKHLRCSPNCSLLLRCNLNNKAINPYELEKLLDIFNYDVSATREVKIHRDAFPEGVIPKSKFNKNERWFSQKEKIILVIIFLLYLCNIKYEIYH